MLCCILLAVATAETELDGTNEIFGKEANQNGEDLHVEEIGRNVEKVAQRDAQDFITIDIEKDEEILL